MDDDECMCDHLHSGDPCQECDCTAWADLDRERDSDSPLYRY